MCLDLFSHSLLVLLRDRIHPAIRWRNNAHWLISLYILLGGHSWGPLRFECSEEGTLIEVRNRASGSHRVLPSKACLLFTYAFLNSHFLLEETHLFHPGSLSFFNDGVVHLQLSWLDRLDIGGEPPILFDSPTQVGFCFGIFLLFRFST